MFCFINCQQISHSYLYFFFTFVAVWYYATSPDFVNYRSSVWQNCQTETTVLRELKHKIEVRGRAWSLVTARLDSTKHFLVIMLVWLIILNLQQLEMFHQICRKLDWHLQRHGAIFCKAALQTKPVPLIHWVLYVAYPVNVTEDLEATCLSWQFEALELNIAIVLHEVYHVRVYIRETGSGPVEAVHVYEAVEVENAKCYFHSVTGSNLDFILSEPRHLVWDMHPCPPLQLPIFDYVEAVLIGVYHFFWAHGFFWPTSRSKNNGLLSVFARARRIGQVFVRILKDKSLAVVVQHVCRAFIEWQLQEAVDSYSSLVSKLSAAVHHLCRDYRQKVTVCLSKPFL